MKNLIKFFNFCFSWKVGVCLEILVILIAGFYYQISYDYMVIFLFVGTMCYVMSILIGMGILYSWFKALSKEKGNIMRFYLCFLVYEVSKCSFELFNGYKYHMAEDIFVSWTYVFGIGYATLSLIYFLTTSRIIQPPKPKSSNLIEENNQHESEV